MKLLHTKLILILFTFQFAAFGQVEFFGKVEPVRIANTMSNEGNLILGNDGQLIFSREKFAGNVGGKADPGDIWMQTDTLITNFTANSANTLTTPVGFDPDGTFYFIDTEKRLGRFEGELKMYTEDDGVRDVQINELNNHSPSPGGCISVDGRYLILSLERPNGYGVEDLYVVRKKANGQWDSPQTLGYRINTQMQEITPFLAADNKTLFFATNAREGYGSFDLYVTTRLDDTWRSWSDPKNLGPAVNTQGAETAFSFIEGAEYGYFISTQNSDGYGDVKRIRIKADIEKVKVDTTTQEMDPVKVDQYLFKVVDSKTRTQLPGFGIYDETQLPITDGVIGMTSDLSGLVEFKSEGYLSREVYVAENYPLNIVNEILLEPLETGNVITLKEVLFYRATANFVEGSESELNMVVEMMKDHPDISIYLRGHTDNVGSQVLNVQLSNERVLAVKHYLVNQGIEPARIDGKGFGGSKPIADNSKEETRQLNRRVEFEVIRK